MLNLAPKNVRGGSQNHLKSYLQVPKTVTRKEAYKGGQKLQTYTHATNISQIIAADETMSPSQAKNDPHHTYVPGKPCENGILCTSSGDQNVILLKLEPLRRLESDPQYLLAKTSVDIKLNKSNLLRAPKTTMKALITDLTYEIPYAKNS